MKILIFSDYVSTWNIGGATRVLQEQIRGLLEDEHEVELISGYPGDDEKEQSLGIPWHRCTYKSASYLLNLAQLSKKVCHAFKPDIAHFHQPLIAAITHRYITKDTPKIYHFHSYWYDEKVSHSDGSLQDRFVLSIKKRIENYALAKMDSFIVLSEWSKQRLRETITDDEIHVIPGSINCYTWDNSKTKHDNYAFLSVRRFDPRMGLDKLIKAFAKIHSEDPNCKLTLVGRGREEANLKNLVLELNLESSITFLSALSQEELQEQFSLHDCMVIPTQELEGFGMVVVESFAAGLPVLATNVGGLASFKPFNKIFHCLEKTDVESLQNGLKWAIDNFNQDKDLEKQCKTVAREHFDTKATTKTLVNLYRNSLCDESSKNISC